MSQVACFSSSTYAERPVGFWWEGMYWPVREVVRRWREPRGVGFWVRAEQARLFELFYGEEEDEWTIQPL